MAEKEYIERETAIKEFSNNGSIFVYGKQQCKAIVSRLNAIPAADVREVVRGKWILYKDRDSTGKFEYVQWSCSACKSNVRTGQPRFDSTLRERPRFNFCPNCGADMREPPKEE